MLSSNPGFFPANDALRNTRYASSSPSPTNLVLKKSFTDRLAINSSSGERIKQSTGECPFQPFIIACANGCAGSNALDASWNLRAMKARCLGVRLNSTFDTQVLMKFSFKNATFCSSERATASSLFQSLSTTHPPAVHLWR